MERCLARVGTHCALDLAEQNAEAGAHLVPSLSDIGVAIGAGTWGAEEALDTGLRHVRSRLAVEELVRRLGVESHAEDTLVTEFVGWLASPLVRTPEDVLDWLESSSWVDELYGERPGVLLVISEILASMGGARGDTP